MKRIKRSRSSQGFSFIELLVAMSIAVLIMILASPQLAKTSREKTDAKSAAMKLVDDLRYLRQRAISTRLPAALIIPNGSLQNGHAVKYYMKEGYREDTTLAKVYYPQLYRDVSLFVGVWDLDAGALQDCTLTTSSAPIGRHYNDSGYEIETWANIADAYTFLFTPEGSVVTNRNMPHFDNAYHIVVGKFFTYDSTSAPPGAVLGSTACLNRFFRLTKVWNPVYTVTVTPLGEIELSEGVKAATPVLFSSAPPQGPGKEVIDVCVSGPGFNCTKIDSVSITPKLNSLCYPASTGVDATVMPGGHLSLEVTAHSSHGEPMTLYGTATGGSFASGSVKCPMEYRATSGKYYGMLEWYAPPGAAAGTQFSISLTAESTNSSDQCRKTVEVLGGRRVFFESVRNDVENIYSMNPDGTDLRNVTNDSFCNANPFISYDGTKVTFVSSRDGMLNVFLMNIDGTGQTNLTHNPTNEREPCFSPDGSKIAFGREKIVDGNTTIDIFTMNSDGTDVKQITDT